MSIIRLIAYFFVYVVVFIIVLLLSILLDKIRDSKLSIRKRIILSVVLSLMISGVGGVIIQHIQNATNKVTEAAVDTVQVVIMYSLDRLTSQTTPNTEDVAQPVLDVEPEHTQEPQASDVVEEQVQVQDVVDVEYPNTIDVSLPLESRVLVPEWSVYPSENMVAVDVFSSGRHDAGGYKGRFRSSSAITYAFTSEMDDSPALLYELEVEILHNPYVSDMIAQEIASYYPDEEWFQEFKDKTDAAFDIPYGTEPRGLEIWYAAYIFSDGQSEIYVTDEYRGYAEQLCQFLETFENLGVKTQPSYAYYDGGAIQYSTMRAFRREAVYELESLILRKGNVIMGFDLNDKGLMVYSTPL